MQITHSAWIVYSMCSLGLIWAITQTVLIMTYKMDPNKVKASVHAQPDFNKGLTDMENRMSELTGKKSSESLVRVDVPQTPEACFNMMKHIAETI